MDITIGVIGAGVMGQGVAQRFAQYGFKVILVDLKETILQHAVNEIERNLKLSALLQKNSKAAEVMERIHPTIAYEDLKNADFLVENVPEVLALKKEVYHKMEAVAAEKCMFLANTSCIPITLLASYTARKEQVIGVHFMNPVPLKNFSEVIRGYDTTQQTVEEVVKLLDHIGIAVEVIHDRAGFVSNRLSHLFMNEAAFLVYEQVAEPKQIDNIFKKAFGHKMGPLETADLIGLDTVLDSLKILYEQYEDSKFRACPLLKQMVYAGKLGRKSKKGFYEY